MKKQLRQKCECGLVFRYTADFEEHKRVGCVVKSSAGPTFSDKDVDEVPGEFQPEAQSEPVIEAPAAQPARAKRKLKV